MRGSGAAVEVREHEGVHEDRRAVDQQEASRVGALLETIAFELDKTFQSDHDRTKPCGQRRLYCVSIVLECYGVRLDLRVGPEVDDDQISRLRECLHALLVESM